MEKRPLNPAEITDFTINTSIDKVNGSFIKLLILSILAGAFIAFAKRVLIWQLLIFLQNQTLTV